jgi:hypothetical protein
MAYVGDRLAASSASYRTVTGSVAPSQVLAADGGRFGIVFFNDSNQTVYLGYAAGSSGVSVTKFTTKVVAQSGFIQERPYIGPVAVVWQTLPTTGSLLITELF